MAAKKKIASKSKTQTTSKAKVGAKKVAKKPAKKADTLLGRIVQKSAQLVLASGILGEVPPAKSKSSKKKRARKA